MNVAGSAGLVLALDRVLRTKPTLRETLLVSVVLGGCITSAPPPQQPQQQPAPPAYAEAQMQATVEIEQSGPPGGSGDVFALAADMIRNAPPPMTSANVVQVAQSVPPQRTTMAASAALPVAQDPSVSGTANASGAFGGDVRSGDLFGNVGASYGGASYGGAATFAGPTPAVAPPTMSPAEAIELSRKFPKQTFTSGNNIYFQGEIMPGMRPATPHVPRQRTSDPQLLRRFGVARDFMISIAATHHIHTSFNFVGSPTNEYIPVAETSDGGFLVVASDHSIKTQKLPWAERPTLYRLNRLGKIVWRADLTSRQQKFAAYESQGVIVAADQSIRVRVDNYRTPGSSGFPRFIKLLADGQIEWDVRLPGNGGINSPLAHNWKLDAAGNLALWGGIALSTDCVDIHNWVNCTRSWQGTISADGRVVSGEPGAIMPDATPALPPVKDNMWNAIDPVSKYE